MRMSSLSVFLCTFYFLGSISSPLLRSFRSNMCCSFECPAIHWLTSALQLVCVRSCCILFFYHIIYFVLVVVVLDAEFLNSEIEVALNGTHCQKHRQHESFTYASFLPTLPSYKYGTHLLSQGIAFGSFQSQWILCDFFLLYWQFTSQGQRFDACKV